MCLAVYFWKYWKLAIIGDHSLSVCPGNIQATEGHDEYEYSSSLWDKFILLRLDEKFQVLQLWDFRHHASGVLGPLFDLRLVVA